ncbi:MAG: MetQ/NlpA family ABC transporter substrate-binding protein [Clostridia bacterium]|nr:MetQ/NlpA family ABC transporter substrate-binding protein [Clostridia bacterium]
MKKIIILVLSLIVAFAAIGCEKEADEKVIKVGATPVPHAELLNLVKEDLKEKGYTLEVVEFTDYVTPNIALSDGDIDANFFQHVPYLEEFSAEHNLDLASIGTIHVEPLGLYSEKIVTIDELKEGSVIGIPSDSVNGGRALILLENNGLIKLKENAGLKATEKDIVENPKNLVFKPIEAAQLPRVLPDVDAAIINGNYALEAGLSPAEDALILEGAESPYANIITVRSEDQNNEALLALVDALQTDKVKTYIEENYGGGVVEAFSK